MATQSMFTNPYDAQMSQEAARRKEMRDVAQMDAYDYHAYQAGMAGQDVARGLGGMLGMQTPEDAKQAKIEEVMGQFGEGKKTPEQLMQIADSFRAAGMLDLWEEVMGMAKDMETTTTASDNRGAHEKRLDTAAQLVPCVAKAGGNWRTADAECQALVEIKATELKGTTAQQKGEAAYSAEVLTALAKKDEEAIDSADAAIEAVLKTQNVLNLLKEGEVNTGYFAEFKNNISSILAEAGVESSTKYASRTQLLEALLGSDVFPMIKQLGIGARGLDTVAEREFLLKVMTGEKSMTPETIRELTEIRQNISKRLIDKFNAKVDRGGFERYTSVTKNIVERIDLEEIMGSKDTVTVDMQPITINGKQVGYFDIKTQKYYDMNKKATNANNLAGE